MYRIIGDKRGKNESGAEETRQSKSTNLSKISVSPNPFTEKADIRFSMLDAEYQPAPPGGARPGITDDRLQIKIYDCSGRLVKKFSLPTTYSLLPTVVSWNGTDSSNRKLPAGVYFLRVTSSISTQTLPVILLR